MVMRGAWGVRIGILAASLVTSWLGCTSSSDDTPTPGDAGSDGTYELQPDTAVAEAAATDAGVDAAPSDRVGSVFTISDTTTAGGAMSSYRAGASFRHITSPDTTVTTKTIGPCLLETYGDGEQAKEVVLSAGVVQIAGGSTPITLTPKSDSTYAISTANTSLYSGGQTLMVTAAGKDVPAFTTSLVAPSAVTLSAPAAPGGSLTVTRSAGVTATFTGASSGDVVLYFDAAATDKAYSLTCKFKAAAGTGVIPAAAFADFPAGNGTFDFYTSETSVATPPGWYVRFTASKAMLDSAGNGLAGNATFQ